MYKTIRHGENSLQYTILPQNDDFRLESKIKTGGSGGSSRKNKAKKPKRRSFFAYLGLLFVCTVIIGAVLVPFLVSAECLPNPTEWFLKTKSAFSIKSADSKDNVLPHLNIQPNIMVNKGNMAINVGKPVKIINKDGVEKFILKVNKSLSMEVPKASNGTIIKDIGTGNSSESPIKSNYSISNTVEPETSKQTFTEKISVTRLSLNRGNIVTETQTVFAKDIPVGTTKSMPPPTTLSDILADATDPITLSPLLHRSSSSAAIPNVPRASLQSALTQNSNSSSTQPTITTRIMQLPLLKSTAKKAPIPPVLVKNLSPIRTTTDSSSLNDILPAKTAVKVVNEKNAVNSNWIRTHWPYIDPSTYFQWNGYKTEDSVLLPALLGFALIGVILIIAVCLVARNKRILVASMRKRNRNDLEETGAEDNTTLLTNTNLSDED